MEIEVYPRTCLWRERPVPAPILGEDNTEGIRENPQALPHLPATTQSWAPSSIIPGPVHSFATALELPACPLAHSPHASPHHLSAPISTTQSPQESLPTPLNRPFPRPCSALIRLISCLPSLRSSPVLQTMCLLGPQHPCSHCRSARNVLPCSTGP